MEQSKDDSIKTSEKPRLFKIQEASQILGGMPPSSIRKCVNKGLLKYCEHLGKRPYYFTAQHLEDFINYQSGK